MSEKKKQGFASMNPELHKQISASGGKKTGVNKGFGALTASGRRDNASRAAKARWEKHRAERQKVTDTD